MDKKLEKKILEEIVLLKGKVEDLEQINFELKETIEILQDSKIMKRFKQKSKGKNISLDEMKNRFEVKNTLDS